jgi:23S rRNA (uracil1939-C5)-methyltransferase
LEALGEVLVPLLARDHFCRVQVTLAANGIDVDVMDERCSAREEAAERVTQRAAAMPALRRVTVNQDLLYIEGAPEIRLGPARVELPAGAFLQATQPSEALLAELVLAGVGTAERIADLYCGLGTFTFPMAVGARVHALEGNDAALQALAKAARQTPGLKAITTQRRDLAKDPLTPAELAGFEAVVFDPPHAGAAAQAGALARSAVPRIVAVSCNPQSLADDLRVLIDGGYRLERVSPVDQFVRSHNLECVAVLSRTR